MLPQKDKKDTFQTHLDQRVCCTKFSSWESQLLLIYIGKRIGLNEAFRS